MTHHCFVVILKSFSFPLMFLPDMVQGKCGPQVVSSIDTIVRGQWVFCSSRVSRLLHRKILFLVPLTGLACLHGW